MKKKFEEVHSNLYKFAIEIEDGKLKKAEAFGRKDEHIVYIEGQGGNIDKNIIQYVIEGIIYNDISHLKEMYDELSNDPEIRTLILEIRDELISDLSF